VDRETIEGKALETLARTVGLKVPVDVIAVSKANRVEVLEGTFPDRLSGVVTKDGARIAIYVNRTHATVRKRYTVAHELGHVLLGHLQGGRAALEDETGQLFLFRSSEAAGWPREVEANQFAAALLMPRPAVAAAVEEAANPIDPGLLAHRFWVSEAAMTIRLQTLFPQFATRL
jgi:Zn-dependent peptidase ImmA (M78 family)